jgi:hypothetical protein
MTLHLCTVVDPKCWRCELALDEVDEPKPGYPNPGSDAALTMGCLCPVLDNNHGRHLPWQGGWLTVDACPLHGAKPLTRRQLLAQEAEEAIERERALFNAEDAER